MIKASLIKYRLYIFDDNFRKGGTVMTIYEEKNSYEEPVAITDDVDTQPRGLVLFNVNANANANANANVNWNVNWNWNS